MSHQRSAGTVLLLTLAAMLGVTTGLASQAAARRPIAETDLFSGLR